MTPTRQEVIDLLALAKKHSSGCRWSWSSLVAQLDWHLSPRISKRIEAAVSAWDEGGLRFADKVLAETATLTDWDPTEWQFRAGGHRAQLLSVWTRLDRELTATHVLYIKGRHRPPVGHKVNTMTILASQHRFGLLPKTSPNRRRQSTGYFTEVQLYCPIADAQKTAAIEERKVGGPFE